MPTYDDYGTKLVCTVLNRHLMVVKRGSDTCSRLEPNIFEAIKAQCLAHAKGLLTKHLPCILLDNPYYMHDLELWRLAFTSDNHPQQVSFRGKADQLAEAIKDIDFSKPFDEQQANRIRAQFPASGKKADVDADLIIQGELGELDGETKCP